jgi:glutamate synthase domain-containing protein 3
MFETLRQIVYGTPSDSAVRIQTVRDEVVDKVEEESWDWAEVEERAGNARDQLDAGNLPNKGDKIETYLHDISKNYRSRGYPIEDIRIAMDGVEGKAFAEQTT